MNRQPDQYYIDAIQSGEAQAFAVLVERYQGLVYTIVCRMVRNKEDAEEVAQDVFVKAFKSLNTYKGTAKFSTWLYTIAYRKSLDFIKKRNRIPPVKMIEEIGEQEVTTINDALTTLITKERKTHVETAIQQLAADEAALITLYYYEEKSVKELITITGLKPDNIKIKLYRSRKKLFTILKGYVLPETKTI